MNIKAIFAGIDSGDIKFIIGLGLATYGISLLSVAWAFIVPGTVLVADSYSGEILKALAAFRSLGGKSK